MFKNIFKRIDKEENKNFIDKLTENELVEFMDYLLLNKNKSECDKSVDKKSINHYFFKKYDNISLSNSKIDIYFNEENFDNNEKYNVIGNYAGVMLIENKINEHIYLGDNYSDDVLNSDEYDFKNIYEIVVEYYIKEINLKDKYEKYKLTIK